MNNSFNIIITISKTKKITSAKVDFDKNIAKQAHPTSYYSYDQDRIKNLYQTHLEKLKLSTPKSEKVDEIIEIFTTYGQNIENKIFRVLTGIRDKNIYYSKNNIKNPPKHSQLIKIIANPFILIAAYRTIRKNKGALTPASFLPSYIFKELPLEQQEFIEKTYYLPDGINWEIINILSEQIKNNTYQWGASRRIWIPKPGRKDSLRPLTIPPFCDKIIQEAIRMVLEAIYEPTFIKMNCSFGFRASVGVHENIVSIEQNSSGFTTAIEGDIEGAYPNLNNTILLKILGERVSDQKFLNFMRKRLTLTLFDTKDNKYLQTFLGIPQGGIDSPYLFNIYLIGMDEFIISRLKEITEEENKTRKQLAENPAWKKLKSKIDAATKTYKKYKNEYKSLRNKKTITAKYRRSICLKTMFEKVEHRNRLKYLRLKVPFIDPTSNKLRFHYSRYADDFIILGNFSKALAIQFKEELKIWLKINRDATLSDLKTYVTIMRKKPAKFLGFEIKASNNRKIIWKFNGRIKFKERVTGWELNFSPDRQRMIDRLYIKGYCNKKGIPKSIPWLSTFEPHIIINKYNDVMSGFANFYRDFISNSGYLSRWLYILRFSALKTLAQKYNTKISKIMKKFKGKDFGEITASYNCVAKDKNNQTITLQKSWTLLTVARALKAARKFRNIEISNKLKKIKNGEIPFKEFSENQQRTPRIMDGDFLDRINWVNTRTQAGFDLPCAKCGSMEDIEMHHINHVRKSKYSLIPQPDTLRKMMSIRNRKQVPLCRKCHNLVHQGENNQIINLHSPIIPLFDNRIIDIERYIHKGAEYEGLPFIENLQSKGWKTIINSQINN